MAGGAVGEVMNLAFGVARVARVAKGEGGVYWGADGTFVVRVAADVARALWSLNRRPSSLLLWRFEVWGKPLRLARSHF